MAIRLVIMIIVVFSCAVSAGWLTQEQLEFYQRNGYLQIKGLYTPEEMEQISKQTDSAIQDALKIKTGSQHTKILQHGVQYVFDGQTGAISRIVWAGAFYHGLLKAGQKQNLMIAVGQLLQTDSVNHLINQIHPKQPGDGVQFRYHRDIENRRDFDPDWAGDPMFNGGFVQTLLAIDPMSRDNGGLEIFPGSHQCSDALKSWTDQQDCYEHLKSLYGEPVYPALASGEMLFFHPCVAHRSLPNNSARSRRVLINGYSAPGANHKDYPGEGSGQSVRIPDTDTISD